MLSQSLGVTCQNLHPQKKDTEKSKMVCCPPTLPGTNMEVENCPWKAIVPCKQGVFTPLPCWFQSESNSVIRLTAGGSLLRGEGEQSNHRQPRGVGRFHRGDGCAPCDGQTLSHFLHKDHQVQGRQSRVTGLGSRAVVEFVQYVFATCGGFLGWQEWLSYSQSPNPC